MNNNTALEEIDALKIILRESATVSREKTTRFFKTGIGQYAEKDVFIGVNVPTLHKIARDFSSLPLQALYQLLKSEVNEERLLTLLILRRQYIQAPSNIKEEIYHFYLNNLLYVNNWNLVDASAPFILGAHLYDKNRDILLKLAQSQNIWERRVAIVSTAYWIRKHDSAWTLRIALMLLQDTHDLIHKAVGWMLREVGKRDENLLVTFLDHNAEKMPRTMLRYSIEKLPQSLREKYLLRRKI
jgi:3-methyladenine DNA glycosylase AlkD